MADGTLRRRQATKVSLALALLVLTAGVYAPARHYPFYNIDDPYYVTKNPQVAAGLTVHGLIAAFTALDMGGWHPLTVLSHMLDCQVYGLDSGGHHVTNVLFHIANTLLLLIVLARMTGEWWRSAFVAAVFALHPLHVESVVWVSERKDVLSTFFGMLALWSYHSFTQRPTLYRYALVILTFTCSLLAKPMLVTLPFVLLLIDFWPLRRIVLSPSHLVTAARQSPAGHESVAAVLLEKVPLLILAGAVSYVTALTQWHAGSVEYSLQFRLANALVAYAAYIVKFLWPRNLAVFYPMLALPGWQVVGAAVILAGPSVFFVVASRQHPYLLVGWRGTWVFSHQ